MVALLEASRPVNLELVAGESLAVESLANKPLAAEPLVAEPLAARFLAAKSLAAKSLAAKSLAVKPLAAKPLAVKSLAGKCVVAKPRAVASSATVKAGSKEDLFQREYDGDKEGNRSKDEARLDKFELPSEVEEEEGDVIEIFEEEVDAKMKLVTTLKEHVEYWEEMGASKFSLSVIKDGYKMTFEGLDDDLEYEEKNNKSYYADKVFANDAVDELVKVGVLEKV